MKIYDLEHYKEYLINYYYYECDNNEDAIFYRKELLAKMYSDDYLKNVIFQTYNFVNKLLQISKDDYYGYIKIQLESEPNINYVSLNITGGHFSDTIVNDSNGNLYSIFLLKEIFGNRFIIDPCHNDFSYEVEEDNDFCMLSEIPFYFLYIQCEKEIIDEVRNDFNNKKSTFLRQRVL